MALQVWLPLNGNMENQGLANVTITESGGSATYADGKIGLGLSTSSKFWVIRNITLGSEATIAYWSKTTVASKMVWVLECNVSNYLNIYTSSIYTLNTGDSNNNPFKYNGSNVNVIIDGLWHHFAVTFGNNEAKLYIDGEYRGTALTFRSPATTNKPIKLAGGYNNAHSYDWNGMINDFRVYDNCLSAKEVRDLSQALILHYPLDKNNITFSEIGNENLFIGTTLKEIDRGSLTVISDTNWNKYVRYYNGSASNHSFTYLGDFCEDTITLNRNENLGLGFLRKATDISLDSSAYYTLSCEAKCTKAGAELCIGLSYYTTSNSWVWRGGTNPQAFNATNTWQKFTLTFKPDSNTQCISYCFTVRGVASGTDTLTLRKCKLEKGSIATDWSKSPHDSKTLFDCSGFGNDGETKGIIENCYDTPRYEAGSTFANECYVVANEKAKVKDEISVCCWAYMDDWSNYTSCMLLSCTETGGWNFEVNSGKMTFLMGTGASSNTYKQAICTTALADLSSGWHHFVGTYDGLDVKIYIDGVLDGTINGYTTKTPIFYNNNNTIFIGAEAASSKINPAQTPYYFNGKMSDVRIYAKALSANDIEELYKTSAYICDSNVMKGYEFSEVGLIPDEYKQIEYLESVENTVQYIDTGITPEAGHVYDFDFAYMSFSADRKIILGNFKSNDGLYVTSLEVFTGNKFRVYESYNNNTIYDKQSASLQQDTKIFVKAKLDSINNTFVGEYKYDSTQGSVGSGTLSIGTNTNPLYMFNDNRGGSNIQINHSLAIYYMKIYDNGVIVRDFTPVRVGNVGYMYDTVSGQLFGNSGSGSFVLGPDKVYNEIEYLESSGTQRIDTNIVGGKNTAIEIKFYVTSIGSSYEGIFGSRVASNNTNSISLFTQNTSNVNHRFGSQVLATQIKINTLYTIYLDKTKITINGTTTNWNQTADFTTPGTLTLFGVDSFTKSKCKIYYTKIWENEELVLDLIPVRVGDIGYMYDRVTGELYGNSGTGNFVLGAYADDYESTYGFVNIYKSGLVVAGDFTETSGSTTFGNSYIQSEEFVEI